MFLLDKKKERKFVRGNGLNSPYYSQFWGYRTFSYNRIDEPGYYVTDTRNFWESNLYEMPGEKLMYSAQTQSFEPANSVSLVHGYRQMIVKDMVKKNVLDKE